MSTSPHAKKSPSGSDHRTIDKANQQPNLNLRSKIFELSSILECAKVSVITQTNEVKLILCFLFACRFVWYTKRSNQSIQRSIYWKSKRINGNFWPTHSPSICECASHTWVCRTGSYALRTHALYRRGPNSYSYCWPHICLSTTIAIHPHQIAYHLDHGNPLFTTNWTCQFSDRNLNAISKQINLANKPLSGIRDVRLIAGSDSDSCEMTK